MKKGLQLGKRLSPSLSNIFNFNASTYSPLRSSPWWSASQHRGVKVNAIHLRAGNVIEKSGRVYQIVDSEHKQRGRGGALMQVELRDVDNGNKVSFRFGPEEPVEKEIKVRLQLYDGRPLSGSVPKRVICTIKETQTPMKGVSATPRYHPILILVKK